MNVIDSVRRGLADVVTSVGATVGFVQTYALPFDWNRGVSGRWWEAIRRRASRLVGAVVDERAGPRPITEGEFAGALSMSLDDAETLLRHEGFVRNPFSRLKVRAGQPEAGSWVYRASPLARRQLHLMLFVRDGGVDVYAHEEPSSVHPLAGATHFDGTDQRVATGVRRARERLPLETAGATGEPTDEPWTAHSIDRGRGRSDGPASHENGF